MNQVFKVYKKHLTVNLSFLTTYRRSSVTIPFQNFRYRPPSVQPASVISLFLSAKVIQFSSDSALTWKQNAEFELN